MVSQDRQSYSCGQRNTQKHIDFVKEKRLGSLNADSIYCFFLLYGDTPPIHQMVTEGISLKTKGLKLDCFKKIILTCLSVKLNCALIKHCNALTMKV